MELRHLRYFSAVAQMLNFRRAAELLRVTQPSLSAQIRQLEEEIGFRLLNRTTHHVELTPAGKQFLEDSLRILQEAEYSVRAARQISRGEASRISIGFVGSISHGILPGILERFRALFPDVELNISELDTALQIQALQTRRIDLGIIGLGMPEDKTGEIRHVDIAEEKLMAVLPEGHPLIPPPTARIKTIRLSALANEAFLFAGKSYSPLVNAWMIVLCQQAGFQPRIIQEKGQSMTLINHVAAGLGITLLPAQFSRMNIPGVHFVPLAKPVPGYRYCAAWWHQNKHPAIPEFVETAIRYMKSK